MIAFLAMPMDLAQLERLTEEWKKLQPLSSTNDERLWLKLRLEWNYHSNHIEGNTLTYGETVNLLLHDQHLGNHSGREYEEMKGHDLAIKRVRELAASSQEITEAHIRDLNQILLKESFYKDALTPEGIPTQKLINPGRYKEQPNSVRTSTGELFEYAAPMDVPPRMGKLVASLRDSLRWEGLTLLAWLAKTHHEFTLIHPFDDGNGRVARLVTNYTLLKKGLLPLVIRSEKKGDYLRALRQADGGDLALLADFLADQLVWSLELGIKSAKGESLEEPSDIEKEIALFVKEREKAQKDPLKKTEQDIQKLWVESVKPLLLQLSEKTKEIGKLFCSRKIRVSTDFGGSSFSMVEGIFKMPPHLDATRGIQIYIEFNGYRSSSENPFSFTEHLDITFEDYAYEIRGGIYFPTLTKPYSVMLSQGDIDEIVRKVLKGIFERIKREGTA